MRAFQLRGKATTMPRRSERPPISNSPPRAETWCGLREQCDAGTHLTEVIVTLAWWATGAAPPEEREWPGEEEGAEPPGAEIPPAPPAHPVEGAASDSASTLDASSQ